MKRNLATTAARAAALEGDPLGLVVRHHLRGRLPGVGRLGAHRRMRARRGRRSVRGAPADRRGPAPPRRLRRRHPTHRGAADPHQRRRRREHGSGGKLAAGTVLVEGDEPARFDQVPDGARRHLHGRAARPGCPTTATAGAGSRTRSTGSTSPDSAVTDVRREAKRRSTTKPTVSRCRGGFARTGSAKHKNRALHLAGRSTCSRLRCLGRDGG